MVLSILISYFFLVWPFFFQPLLQVEYLNTSLVQLCPRTRKPARQGEKEEMLWLSLVLNSLSARELMLETLRWHVPLSARFLSCASLVPSSLMGGTFLWRQSFGGAIFIFWGEWVVLLLDHGIANMSLCSVVDKLLVGWVFWAVPFLPATWKQDPLLNYHAVPISTSLEKR